MAASAKKKNKKGKTITLTDFLADQSGGGSAPAPSYPAKTTSWADETVDLDGDVSTSWHTDEDSFRGPPIDRSSLPTAPRSAREPNIDRSRLPRSPPYTAFLGNLPYDVTEESIKDFFRGLAISAVRLPREPSNHERLKGFGYAEFDDVDSLLRALSLNEENLGNRRIRVDIADQSNDKERDSGMMGGRDRGGRMADMGPDKTDSDWRARPSGEESDDGPPRRDDAFGERSRDRYESDRFRDGSRRDYDGGRDRYRDRYDDRDRREYDRGYDSRGGGGGRRAFGSSFRRDYDDNRGSNDRFGDRDRYGERDRYSEDRYERRDEKRDDRAPQQRPKLNLKPRSVPKDEEGGSAGSGGSSPAVAPTSSGRASSIFGDAKPVDTAAKERAVEERLKKQEESFQRQLEEDKGRGPDRKIRDKDPSWRNEESYTERSRTGSESSQTGSGSGRASRCRDNERSGENEVFSGREDEPSSPAPPSQPPPTKEPLKVMPAPPPKENAWAKRSASNTSTADADGRSPVSPVGSAPPKFSSSNSADERESGKDENKAGGAHRDRGPPRARGGPAGPGAGRGEVPNRDRRKEADRKDNRRDRDARPPPEPKKYEESPIPKFSSASKYAALLMDGDGDDAGDVE
ncbi:eukaryotic translation initiation factor 4Ba [Syngnathus acus]|uniref:eukaryotic translation initiation factor 4Ba n=1 Tax=Syngnathus acus TaxID=161584 RepID=UPI0018860FDA|nr:eukaryotic translation initiation factor 4Ba [Syngnathus acus]